MAEAALTVNCEILDCPICFEKYRTPRTLPCLHTFCEECLDTYITAQVKTESEFSCPVCRTSITLPESKAKVETWAAAFPVNHMIVSMMETGERTLDVTTLCDLCKDDSEGSTAEFWCEKCSQALCKLCLKFHNRLSTTSSHESVPITEARTLQKSEKLQHVDENCPLHAGKTVEVYCSDHGQLCCVVCFATKHRECKHISDIDAISKETEVPVFSKFIENLAGVTAEMDKIITEKSENLTKIDSENETIFREMESTVAQAKQHLDKLLSVFKDEVSSTHTRGRNSLLASQKEVQAFIKNVENAQKLLQTVIHSSSQRQKFITCEKLRCQVLSHYENLKQNLQDDQQLSLVLNMDSVFEQCVHKMASLGVVENIQKPSSTSRNVLSCVSETLHRNIQADQSSAQIPVVDLLSASVSLEKVVMKSELGARSCWLTGGTFLNNGNLLLADDDNKRLIEIGGNWTLIRKHKVDGRPTAISQMNQENILVTFENEKRICCYELKSELKLVYTKTLKRSAWGVAACGDKVVLGVEGYVDILSQEDDVITSITSDTGGIGNMIVAVCKTLKTIYHRNKDTVVCRDLRGKELFTYSNPKLSGPRGMGIDSNDNLYVCGKMSGNLHQVSSDGQRSRILIEKFHSITHPYCVVVHPSQKVIVITSFSESTAFEVYRLKKMDLASSI